MSLNNSLDSDRCECSCHADGAVHIAACCYTCGVCHARIRAGRWDAHEAAHAAERDRVRAFAAAGTLRVHLCGTSYDHRSWVSSIGVGSHEGSTALVVMLRTRPIPSIQSVPDEWEGFPVATRFFGEFAPLGPVD